jgi:aminopeptidase N
MKPLDAVATRLVDYAPPAYRMLTTELDLDLDPDATVVRARLTLQRNAPGPLRLDGEDLTLRAIRLDGADVAPDRYSLDEAGLTLADAPDACVLETEVVINPAANTKLSGLYVSGGRFCTQCEAEGFRRITFFPDRPDVMSVFTVRMTADRARFPTLLSNGNCIEAGDAGAGRHLAVWRDPWPKPAYLFALCAGAYDHIADSFTTMSGREVTLGIYVDPGDAARAHYAMDALKRSFAWDETAFGREYDLDIFNIVAVRDFNFGAMENKGLNIFNSSLLLADPETATDLDYELIEAVVGHEYFHNWTGDRITLRDWFQLSLKEGLTVFRDQEFSADQRSRPVERIKSIRNLRARQFAEDAGPLAHPVRPPSYQKIDNFYTATVYEKGAEVIRVLKTLLGDDGFAAGIALYFDRCDGTAATVEDFLACFEEAAGQDLSRFKRWYEQAGTPRLIARQSFAGGVLTVTLRQEPPAVADPATWAHVPIPVRVGVVGPNGGEAAPEQRVVVGDEETTVRFGGLSARPALSLLRGFSAPVVVDADVTGDDLAVLAAHDSDPFVRWDAVQRLARAAFLAGADAVLSGGPEPDVGRLVDAMRGALALREADPAFAALLLRLPDLGDLVQAREPVDAEALYQGRAGVRARVAAALRNDLEAIVAAGGPPGPFSPDAGSAGRRSLLAAALDLLAALGPEIGGAAAKAAFDASRSMTETMAALDALGSSGSDRFDAALGVFAQRWAGNPLVMDKWFSVQAASPRADAPARIEALRSHPDFTLSNPNRVRALAGAFAMRNLRWFHASDGSGYRFLAQMIGEIDPMNPALAARLAGAFESWRRLEPVSRAAAEAALAGLAERANLSANLSEIVGRTLGRS